MDKDFDRRFFQSLRAQGFDLPAPQVLLGGRSNLVWRADHLVIKLYLKRVENPLFDNDPTREIAALNALSGTGMVPSALGSGVFEGRDWLIYGHITGDVWSEDAAHVAQLLGRLHDQPVFGGLPNGRNGSQALEVQTGSILDLCWSKPDQVDLLKKARPGKLVPPTDQLCLIHGDPVPGNLVAHDGTLTLIDWQCPQRGDPAEDLALFLSPAMQFLYRGAVLSQQEEESFLQAYPDPRVVERYLRLKPWYHWRMTAYALWRCQAGEARDHVAYDLEKAALSQSIRPSSA